MCGIDCPQHEVPLAATTRRYRVVATWPLQDIRLLWSFCARVNHSRIPPPNCIAHTIATLLHGHCVMYDPPQLTLCMPYTVQN